jgi:hypothetical protein
MSITDVDDLVIAVKLLFITKDNREILSLHINVDTVITYHW